MTVVMSPERPTCLSPPPSSTDVAFQYPFRVRFSEVDQAGVVYFSRIYEYCHAAFEELLRAAGMPLEGMLHTVGWGMPLVHTEADYHRPLRLGEELRVEVEVIQPSARRVLFGFKIVDTQGKVRARARHEHACVGMDDFKPRDVPSVFLDGLARAGLIDQG